MADRYEKLRIPPGLSGLVGRFSDYKGTRVYRQHNHLELELNLVLGGSLDYIIRGEKYTLRKGTILWLFPGQRHGAAGYSSDFDMLIALFTPDLVKRVCSPPEHILRSENPGEVLIRTLSPEEGEYLTALLTDLEGLSGDSKLFNSGLEYGLLRSWQSFREAEAKRRAGRLHPSVAAMIRLISSSGKEMSLPELAGETGISYSRLSRIFKEQTGQTIGEFRDRVQVELFCELLQKTPYRTISDCAMEAGFGSYAQFYRVFKKITGRSPGLFRREELNPYSD